MSGMTSQTNAKRVLCAHGSPSVSFCDLSRSRRSTIEKPARRTFFLISPLQVLGCCARTVASDLTLISRCFPFDTNTDFCLCVTAAAVPPSETVSTIRFGSSGQSTTYAIRQQIILDAEGQRLEGVIGPYEEGHNLLLICEAEGGECARLSGVHWSRARLASPFLSAPVSAGDPLPSVKWWRGGEVIDESYTAAARGFVRNELQLSDLGRDDLLAVLTCQSSNTELVVPSEISVSLDLTRECESRDSRSARS